jgi:nucleoside 2-deoxyribosyltransferase
MDNNKQPTVKPLVYMAGPIKGNQLGCVREAIPIFRRLRDIGFVPFMPQLSVIMEMVESMEYEEYMAYDFDMLRHCDLLVRIPGISPGADREVSFCHGHGIPVIILDRDLDYEIEYAPVVDWMNRYMEKEYFN